MKFYVPMHEPLDLLKVVTDASKNSGITANAIICNYIQNTLNKKSQFTAYDKESKALQRCVDKKENKINLIAEIEIKNSAKNIRACTKHNNGTHSIKVNMLQPYAINAVAFIDLNKVAARKRTALTIGGALFICGALFLSGFGSLLLCALAGISITVAATTLHRWYSVTTADKYRAQITNDKYRAQITKTQNKINRLIEELPNFKKNVLKKHLSNLSSKVSKLQFDGAGKLKSLADQPACDKLVVLNWELRKINRLKNLSKDKKSYQAYAEKVLQKKGPAF